VTDEISKTESNNEIERSKKNLSPAAQRALSEAEERRKLAEKKSDLEAEQGGRKGPEPTRYGDWEKGGLAIDF